MTIVRRIGSLILVAAALTVWFSMAPNELDHGDKTSAIETIGDLNNDRAEGAPQQSVVNGWTANDYLQLLSEQLDAQTTADTRDQRPAAMLGLCVIGIALLGVTTSGHGSPAAAKPSFANAAAPAMAVSH